MSFNLNDIWIRLKCAAPAGWILHLHEHVIAALLLVPKRLLRTVPWNTLKMASVSRASTPRFSYDIILVSSGRRSDSK